MEMRILYTDDDPEPGRLHICIPAYTDHTRHADDTDDALIARIIAKLPPGAAYSVVPITDIPSDRTFRNAFEDNGSAVTINMPKARSIHMEHIRQVRNAELARLDVPFTRALEAVDTAEQRRIAALKQELRDIPQTFNLARFRTPATLKSAWPAQLPRA